jgi:hypothetical protein
MQITSNTPKLFQRKKKQARMNLLEYLLPIRSNAMYKISFIALCMVFITSCHSASDPASEPSPQPTDAVQNKPMQTWDDINEKQKKEFMEKAYAELMRRITEGAPYDWYVKAELVIHDHFTDPKVIELCEAIQRADVAAVEQIINDGVDINARGKGDVTPLFWSLYSSIDVFNLLLEHGADPNVQLTLPIGDRWHNERGTGESVTSVAVIMPLQVHFDSVMNHGGNPNLVNTYTTYSLLYSAVAENGTLERVKALVDKGADINDREALIKAMMRKRYDILFFLLESGADYSQVKEGRTIVHVFSLDYDELITDATAHGEGYRKILKWLKEKNVSVERAKKEREEWKRLEETLPIATWKRWRKFRETDTNVEGSNDRKVIEYRVWHRFDDKAISGKHRFLTWLKWDLSSNNDIVILEFGEPEERLFDRAYIHSKYLCPEDREAVKRLFAEKMLAEFKQCAVRQWSTQDGEFNAEALPVRLEDESIVLKRQDTGEEVTVPFENLSQEDIRYLDSLTQIPPLE